MTQAIKTKVVEHGRPKAESTVSLFFKTAKALPSFLWRLQHYKKVKSSRFWYINSNNEPIKGLMYRKDGREKKALIAFDAGLGNQRSLLNKKLRWLGRGIACLFDCDVFSIASLHEMERREAFDYGEAFYYLRHCSPDHRGRYNGKAAFMNCSGKGNIGFVECSSDYFLRNNDVRALEAISTFARLDDEAEYVDESLANPKGLDKHELSVLTEYNRESVKRKLYPTRNPKLAREGSPETSAPNVKVPTLLICGLDDKIVTTRREAINTIDDGTVIHRFIDVFYDRGTVRLNSVMIRAGRDVTFVALEGKGIHADSNLWFRNLRETIGLISMCVNTYLFLKQHLEER